MLIYSNNYSLFDTPQERYAKLYAIAQEIIPVQVGVTAFLFNPDENSYTGKVYSFYLFPRSFISTDKTFMCQASSLQFLCDHAFDFNKVLISCF